MYCLLCIPPDLALNHVGAMLPDYCFYQDNIFLPNTVFNLVLTNYVVLICIFLGCTFFTIMCTNGFIWYFYELGRKFRHFYKKNLFTLNFTEVAFKVYDLGEFVPNVEVLCSNYTC